MKIGWPRTKPAPTACGDAAGFDDCVDKASWTMLHSVPAAATAHRLCLHWSSLCGSNSEPYHGKAPDSTRGDGLALIRTQSSRFPPANAQAAANTMAGCRWPARAETARTYNSCCTRGGWWRGADRVHPSKERVELSRGVKARLVGELGGLLLIRRPHADGWFAPQSVASQAFPRLARRRGRKVTK